MKCTCSANNFICIKLVFSSNSGICMVIFEVFIVFFLNFNNFLAKSSSLFQLIPDSLFSHTQPNNHKLGCRLNSHMDQTMLSDGSGCTI